MGAVKIQKRKSISQDFDDSRAKKRKSVHKKEGSQSDRKACSSQDAGDSKGCGVFSRLIDAGSVRLNEIVSYIRRKDGFVMKEGQVTRDGVLCSCCGHVFLLSKFEGHAGSTLHRPSANMFLQDGRSIQQCLFQVEASGSSKQLHKEERRERLEQMDSSVGFKQRHAGESRERSEQIGSSAGFKQVHTGESRERSEHVNSVYNTDDEVSVSPNEMHTEKNRDSSVEMTSSVKSVDCNDDVCQVCGDGGELMLCDNCPSAFHAACIDLDSVPEGDWYCSICRCGRCGGNCNIGETGKQVLCCSQCDGNFHRHCVEADSLCQFEGHWFCAQRCKDVFVRLRRLVGVNNTLENGLSWMLLRSCGEDEEPLFTKKKTTAEHENKLSVGLEVLQECFLPIVDCETKIDLISQSVFNRKSKLRRLNCSRFFTMLLSRGEQVISVATVRVHGSTLAEMPFLGTRHQYRQQGMCRQLMHALEAMLRGIGVYRLVLPSVPEFEDAWTGAFGFKYMSLSGQKELSGYSLMSFPGTRLLERRLISSEFGQPNGQSLNKVEILRYGSFQASCATGNLQHILGELHQTMVPSRNKAAAASLHPIICT